MAAIEKQINRETLGRRRATQHPMLSPPPPPPPQFQLPSAKASSMNRKRQQKPTTSLRYISILPDHILKEIFYKLPITFLISQCKPVCKLWKQILSDPDFASLHISRKQPSSLFLFMLNRKLCWFEIQGQSWFINLAGKIQRNVQDELRFVNSCNGLVCVCMGRFFSGHWVVHVLNPMTGEIFRLPPLRIKHRDSTPDLCGIGFCSKTNKYKVVRVTFPDHGGFGRIGDYIFEAEVYTLGSGAWRHIGEIPHFRYWTAFDAFVNGCCHWYVNDDDFCMYKICAFDFETEQFKAFEFPSESYAYPGDFNSTNIGVFGESLFFFCHRDYSYEVWLMKEYGVEESWEKILVIENRFLANAWGVRLIKLWEDGDVLLQCDDEMVLYNIKRNSCIAPNGYDIKTDIFTIVHNPCFASLKAIVAGDSSKILTAGSRN